MCCCVYVWVFGGDSKVASVAVYFDVFGALWEIVEEEIEECGG